MDAYDLVRRLGSGAASSVYIGTAVDGEDRPLAIKLFRTSLSSGAYSARALRELELLSAVQLPCVPRIHDYGMDRGRFYLAMDLIDGERLDVYCDKQAMDRPSKIELLARVARSAQQLHEFGIIHRDLKPSNILVRRNGEPALVDFGIAALLHPTDSEPITSEGVAVGTPGFMAPEQARGEVFGCSTRTDVFALGAIGFWMLTGKTPFDTLASEHEVVRRIANDNPRSANQLDPSIPKPLAAILDKAVAREPRHRFAGAEELADHLDRYQRGEPITIAGPSALDHARYIVRRNPVASLLAAAAIVATMGMLYFILAASAEARMREEQQVLAERQTALAEDRRAFAGEQAAFATRAKNQLEGVRNIVRKFLQEAAGHAGEGRFGEALAIIRGIDHLLQPGVFEEPALNMQQRELRLEILIDALHEIYRTAELGGEAQIDQISHILREIEAQRMDAHKR